MQTISVLLRFVPRKHSQYDAFSVVYSYFKAVRITIQAQSQSGGAQRKKDEPVSPTR